jgi:cystathionine beta-lyase
MSDETRPRAETSHQTDDQHGIDTRIVHVGRDPFANHGIVNPPVHHASTVLFPTLDALAKAAADPTRGV